MLVETVSKPTEQIEKYNPKNSRTNKKHGTTSNNYPIKHRQTGGTVKDVKERHILQEVRVQINLLGSSPTEGHKI